MVLLCIYMLNHGVERLFMNLLAILSLLLGNIYTYCPFLN